MGTSAGRRRNLRSQPPESPQGRYSLLRFTGSRSKTGPWSQEGTWSFLRTPLGAPATSWTQNLPRLGPSPQSPLNKSALRRRVGRRLPVSGPPAFLQRTAPLRPALRSFPPASRQGRAVSGPPRSHPAHTEEKSIFREVPLRSENFSYRKSDPFGEQETGKDVESAETREYTLPKTKECKIKV